MAKRRAAVGRACLCHRGVLGRIPRHDLTLGIDAELQGIEVIEDIACLLLAGLLAVALVAILFEDGLDVLLKSAAVAGRAAVNRSRAGRAFMKSGMGG
jgi:hypothetical protein